MNNYIKVKGHENFYRDPHTGAIINANIPSKNNFSSKFNNVVEDLNNLKNEMSEIKDLLKELINKK